MELAVSLTSETLDLNLFLEKPDSSDGAQLLFLGRVRHQENESLIAGLIYEAYPEMALKEMRRLADEINLLHPVSGAHMIHRLGKVPVGAVAVALAVTSTHRENGQLFLREWLNRLKRDVPIWKTGSY